jgi:hypothetical protein
MQSTTGLRTLIATGLLTAAFATFAGAAAADPGTEAKEKKVEKHRIVVVNENGHERVIEGDGLLVRRGFLGVGLTEMTPELRAHFGVPEESGVMVSRVEAGSPAEKAGLKVGDVITAVDGKPVQVSWDVRAQIGEGEDGQQVPLEVWRNGKVQTLTAGIVLRERPEMDMGPLFFKSKDGDDVLLRFDKELGPGAPRLRGPGPGGHMRVPGPGAPGAPEIRVQRLRSPREAELEKKVQELEKRLDELERQLRQKK